MDTWDLRRTNRYRLHQLDHRRLCHRKTTNQKIKEFCSSTDSTIYYFLPKGCGESSLLDVVIKSGHISISKLLFMISSQAFLSISTKIRKIMTCCSSDSQCEGVCSTDKCVILCKVFVVDDDKDVVVFSHTRLDTQIHTSSWILAFLPNVIFRSSSEKRIQEREVGLRDSKTPYRKVHSIQGPIQVIRIHNEKQEEANLSFLLLKFLFFVMRLPCPLQLTLSHRLTLCPRIFSLLFFPFCSSLSTENSWLGHTNSLLLLGIILCSSCFRITCALFLNWISQLAYSLCNSLLFLSVGDFIVTSFYCSFRDDYSLFILHSISISFTMWCTLFFHPHFCETVGSKAIFDYLSVSQGE